MLLWFGPIPVLLCLRPFPSSSPGCDPHFPFPIIPCHLCHIWKDGQGLRWTLLSSCASAFSFGWRWFSGLPPFFTFFFFRLVFLATAFRFSGDTHAIAEYVASLTMEISEGWLCCDSQWQEGLLGPHRSILSGHGSLWTWRLLWRDAP